VCAWIGSGFCSGNGPWQVIDGKLVRTEKRDGVVRQLPHLGNAGRGINRQIPHLSGSGQGINRKLSHLGDAGKGVNRSESVRVGAYEWFAALAARLRTVRVASGDWTRVVTESVTVRHGVTGVFLDPPYGDEIEQTRVYSTDAPNVAKDVRNWCAEHGSDPRLRIALCGYMGEGHEELEDLGWVVVRWRTAGGYGGGRGGTGDANRHRETIWFSPHCMNDREPTLFDEMVPSPSSRAAKEGG
jgi:DNA adenine methylase